MSNIIINGKTFNCSGSINISGSKITVGGIDIFDLESIEEKTITVVVEGNVEDLSVGNGEIVVNGNVRELTTKNGNVRCHSVVGCVESKNGNINCGSVSGNVHTKNGNISRR